MPAEVRGIGVATVEDDPSGLPVDGEVEGELAAVELERQQRHDHQSEDAEPDQDVGGRRQPDRWAAEGRRPYRHAMRRGPVGAESRDGEGSGKRSSRAVKARA